MNDSSVGWPRRIPPVWSPLTVGAVASGVASVLWRSRAAHARAVVEATLRDGGDRELLLVDSGTSALRLALRCTANESARPVAIPAFACYDVATAVLGAGVPFVFYDLDPATLGPDPVSLRAALEAGADRVVLVHLYGIPVDVGRFRALAQEYGAVVIEDAAQGSGGAWAGRPLGQHGSLGVLSFGRGKGATGGGGGALVANDEVGVVAIGRARSMVGPSATTLRSVVALLAQWAFARPSLYAIPSSLPFLGLGETLFQAPHDVGGIMSLSLGVLERTLSLVADEAGVRREQAARLIAALDPAIGRSIAVPEGGTAGYLRLPVLLNDSVAPADLASLRRLGIMPSYPRALPDLDGFVSAVAQPASQFAGAEVLTGRLFTLPVHSRLTAEDVRVLESCCGGS